MKRYLILLLFLSFCGGSAEVIDEVETLSEIDIYTDNIYKIDLVTNFGNTNGTIGDLEVDLVTNFGNTNGTGPSSSFVVPIILYILEN